MSRPTSTSKELRGTNPGALTTLPVQALPVKETRPLMVHSTYDRNDHWLEDAEVALEETALRFAAYVNAVLAAGPEPDGDTFLALTELQFAADHWRERFLDAIGRRGIPLDYLLGPA